MSVVITLCLGSDGFAFQSHHHQAATAGSASKALIQQLLCSINELNVSGSGLGPNAANVKSWCSAEQSYWELEAW